MSLKAATQRRNMHYDVRMVYIHEKCRRHTGKEREQEGVERIYMRKEFKQRISTQACTIMKYMAFMYVIIIKQYCIVVAVASPHQRKEKEEVLCGIHKKQKTLSVQRPQPRTRTSDKKKTWS